MKKLSLNCGSCLFLNREKVFEKKCVELGKLPSSKACGSYVPDAFILAGSPERVNRLKMVSSAIRGMSLTEIQSLAALLHAEKSTRKAGWSFYQRVIVRYTGTSSSNYFSNFAVGFVVYADKDVVRIVGQSGKMMITAMNCKDGDTVYTLDRFKVLAADMTKRKRFVDTTNAGAARGGSYVRPLDDAIGSENKVSKKITVSKTKTDDLVAIIAKMSMGFGGARNGARRNTRSGAGRRAGSGEISMDWRA